MLGRARGGAAACSRCAVADRLARSLTRPVDRAGRHRRTGWAPATCPPGPRPAGPPEVRAVGAGGQPARRADRRAARRRAGDRRRPVAPAAHPADRAAAGRRGAAGRPTASGCWPTWTRWSRGIDEVIAEARRPVREGLGAGCDATAVVADRVRVLVGAGRGRGPRRSRVDLADGPLPVAGRRRRPGGRRRRAARQRLRAHPRGHGVHGGGPPPGAGWCRRRGRDAGPGLPAGAVERGRSGAGSTGLGLDIARRTAEASGGPLRIDASRRGTTVTLELGAPA